MAWARIDDRVIDHQKLEDAGDELGKNGYVVALGALAWGVVYCAKSLSDGFLPERALRRYKVPRNVADAMVKAGLWEISDGGYRVHDYLEWNPTAAEVKEKQAWDRERKALYSDQQLLERIRLRDSDGCRYCGISVNWKDRRSEHGAQFDHVIPRGGNTYENVVVSCRGCNNRKGQRTPEQAGMVLRALSGSDPILGSSSVLVTTPAHEGAQAPRTGRDGRGPDLNSEEKVPGPIMGTQSTHRRHAACGRICVPEFIHVQFIRQLGGSETGASDRLRTWYAEVEKAWDGKPIGDAPEKFWQARFAEWVGSTAAPSKDAAASQQATRQRQAIERNSANVLAIAKGLA